MPDTSTQTTEFNRIILELRAADNLGSLKTLGNQTVILLITCGPQEEITEISGHAWN